MRYLVLLFAVHLHATTLLLDWWPNPNHVPLFVAAEKGFVPDLHILKSFEPPQAMPYLLSKQADIVMYYMPQTLWANRPEVKMIGALIKEPLQGILIRKKGQKKVLGTHPSKLLGRFLKGMKTHYEVKEVQIDLQMAMMMRKIDMAFGFYDHIEGVQMRHHGLDCDFMNVQEMGVPPYYELVFLSLKEQPGFLAGIQKAIEYCRLNPDRAFDLYCKANPDKSQRTLVWEKASWKKALALYPTSLEIDEGVVRGFKKWLFEEGKHQPE